MFATIDVAVEAVREAAAVADPDAVDGAGALRLFEAGEEIERLGATIKVLAAGRIDETRAWKRSGDASHAHFVARTTGGSVKQAVTTVQTARRVDRHGAIADAMRAGDLSADQAGAIAEAVAADPHAEGELLARAESDSLQELRSECRRVKAAARTDELAHDDAIRRSRYLRTWTDAQGAGRGEWKATPDAQARILARIAPEFDAIAAEAQAAGAPGESREAYAIDALARVADATPGEGRSQVAIHLRVDHSAFVRGHTEADEICEIEGVGPVPVATARNLSTDALIYVLATKGTDLTHYAKQGRYIPDKLRLALEARDQVCIALGCNVRDNLEIHHRDPVDNNGETSTKNCCRLCKWHHYLCTHQGWAVGGSAESGWTFNPPTGRSPPDALPLAC